MVSPNLTAYRILSPQADRSPSSLSRIHFADSTESIRKAKMVAVVTRHPSQLGLNINLTSTGPSSSSRTEIIERRSVSKLSRNSIDTLDEVFQLVHG